MPGQPSRSRSRRRKTVFGVRASRKAPAARRRRSAKRPKTPPDDARGAPGRRDAGCGCRRTAAAETRRRPASPEPEGREGKENEGREGRGANRSPGKQQGGGGGGPVFPDDDSNQILPVEQFFGNMDIVQDVPRRDPKGHAQRGSRRRHFYAREDSEDEDPPREGGAT